MLSGLLLLLVTCSTLKAQNIDVSTTPEFVAPGTEHSIPLNFDLPGGGIVQLQLFDSSWNLLASQWTNVEAGSSSAAIPFAVPTDTQPGEGFIWQGLLYDSDWGRLAESFADVEVVADYVSMDSVPMQIESGSTFEIEVDYVASGDGIIQLQLFDGAWNKVASPWKNVTQGNGSSTFTIEIPANISGNDFLWQGIVYDRQWTGKYSRVVDDVVITGGSSTTQDDPLPAGEWELDWADEFEGTGEPENWYPLLGYNHEDFGSKTEKGIRWTGDTEDTAWMYSTRTGNHWLDGEGNLVLRIVADKTESNVHGRKVEAAYLLSGYPEKWIDDPDANVRWAGKFVSPKETPLYISCRVRTDQVVGHSSWFAFWLFTETRAYNDDPADGTEVDIIEIAKGDPDYMDKSFNVAHHWLQSGGSESKQFNDSSEPSSTTFVDVQDNQYHTYGLEWSTESMTCYVDGVPCYTFTENIPSDPVDMMLLLTMEFQKNAWDPNQGDGRYDGPVVSENETMREMSRVYVDFVRVYEKK
jgi:hypothetical protein